MNEQRPVIYSGIGFADLLLITFIILKLCGVITWSWVWVLSPLWIPIVIVLFIFAIAMIVSSFTD